MRLGAFARIEGGPSHAASRHLGATRYRPLQKPIDVARGDDSHQPPSIDDQCAPFAATLWKAKQVRDWISRTGRGHLVEWAHDRFNQGRRASTRRDILKCCQGQESAEPARSVVGWKGRMPRGQYVAMQRILDADVVGSL